MTRFRILLSIGVAALGLMLAAAPAQAQVVWISSKTGDDNNGCANIATPCLTMGGALFQVPTGGVIRCLDLAVSWFVIDKPITLDCSEVASHTSGSGGVSAIAINLDEATYPNGVVTLRGLNLVGFLGGDLVPPGADGIRVTGGGAAVHIEDITIEGFSEQGIDFSPSSTVDLFVKDAVINNNAGGILVAPSAGGRVSLSNVRLDQNAVFGLSVNKASGTFAAVTVEDSNIEKSVFGLRAIGASAFIALSDSVVTNNSTGLQVQSGGKINSAGNNMITLNNVNGVPTAKFALQ